jgi:formamidopyrimidine-DNA glycosylase
MVLENRIVNEWVFCDGGKYQDKKPNGFKEFEKQLPVIVENVECKGKFIYFTVFNEKGYFYILHSLRMTGRWKTAGETRQPGTARPRGPLH